MEAFDFVKKDSASTGFLNQPSMRGGSARVGAGLVAEQLGISEQQVANYKFDLIARLRTLIARSEVSADVFPELYDSATAK